MLSLNADKWKHFEGGYRIKYDASTPLKLLESKNQPDEEIWHELWQELYHQGDVGIASYAAVPQIFRIYREKDWLDYNLPAFAVVVEEARTREKNPEVPDFLKEDYLRTLRDIAQYCLVNSKKVTDREFSRSLLMLVAILLGEKDIYDLLNLVEIGDEKRVLELYEEYG